MVYGMGNVGEVHIYLYQVYMYRVYACVCWSGDREGSVMEQCKARVLGN